jgi:hypothetical protein
MHLLYHNNKKNHYNVDKYDVHEYLYFESGFIKKGYYGIFLPHPTHLGEDKWWKVVDEINQLLGLLLTHYGNIGGLFDE